MPSKHFILYYLEPSINYRYRGNEMCSIVINIDWWKHTEFFIDNMRLRRWVLLVGNHNILDMIWYDNCNSSFASLPYFLTLLWHTAGPGVPYPCCSTKICHKWILFSRFASLGEKQLVNVFFPDQRFWEHNDICKDGVTGGSCNRWHKFILSTSDHQMLWRSMQILLKEKTNIEMHCGIPNFMQKNV